MYGPPTALETAVPYVEWQPLGPEKFLAQLAEQLTGVGLPSVTKLNQSTHFAVRGLKIIFGRK